MSESGKLIVKSDKATIVRRVNEVLRVVLVGGDFDEIRQYAKAQGWGVSDRQLRRYQERAHQKFAQHTQRDQKQLLGRHLMQRRALYARALKTNDIRTALHVLRDEASLQGLYEFAKVEEVSGTSPKSSIPRRQRFKRLLSARMKNDHQQVRLIEESSPTLSYAMPDTYMAEMMLHSMAVMHAAEQLDRASMALLAIWRMSLNDEQYEFWDETATLQAWSFSVERDGWKLFAEELDNDPEWLIAANHRGLFLEFFSDQLNSLAPDRAEVEAFLVRKGRSTEHLVTPQCVARRWRKLLETPLEQ